MKTYTQLQPTRYLTLEHTRGCVRIWDYLKCRIVVGHVGMCNRGIVKPTSWLLLLVALRSDTPPAHKTHDLSIRTCVCVCRAFISAVHRVCVVAEPKYIFYECVIDCKHRPMVLALYVLIRYEL